MCLKFILPALIALNMSWIWAAPVAAPVLDSAPYGWIDALGNPRGLYPDFFMALARQTGLDIRVRIVPFARAANMVAAGNADTTLMFRNGFTEGKVIEAAQVFFTEQIVQTRSDYAIKSREQLVTKLIGRIRGGCGELANDASHAWRFYELNTQQQGVNMLLAQRIDAFCTTGEAIDFALQQVNNKTALARQNRISLGEKPVWLMFSPTLDKETRTALLQGLKQLQQNGEFARIFKRYLGNQYVLKLGNTATPVEK